MRNGSPNRSPLTDPNISTERKSFMLAYLRKVMRRAEDRGASAVEYGLMVAAIAAVIVGAVFTLGTSVKNSFTQTTTTICASASAAGSTQPCP
jgi:pilus assembly protein Flp/PilA